LIRVSPRLADHLDFARAGLFICGSASPASSPAELKKREMERKIDAALAAPHLTSPPRKALRRAGQSLMRIWNGPNLKSYQGFYYNVNKK